jgi:asparagine synthase (glutamine-hydrolysing)
MCGIAAVIDRVTDDASSTIRSMVAALTHRGPDDSDVWRSVDGRVTLGHRRLSVIDLSPLGRNPMVSRDGQYTITYNGEIYNFRTLRHELESAGYQFVSQTDTEVILAAYDRWGIGCLHKFVGMFAFALWDHSRNRMILARDRLGKKPLYYAQYGDRVSVASELKAIASDKRFPRVVDPVAVRLYLRYGYIPAPSSIYVHAKKLPAAHYATVSHGTVEVFRYWDPLPCAVGPPVQDDKDAEHRLEELLHDAVGLRMLADVPVGAFLSGGIDSSLVVALMQEQSSKPVRTFTVRFENRDFNEADSAAAVARHLGTAHNELECDAHQLLGVVDHVNEMFDEPFADSSAVPTYLVSKAARENVTVALSGDGGDELFFGYPRYTYHAVAGSVLSLPRPVRRAVACAAARLPWRQTQRMADVLRCDELDVYGRFITWCRADEIMAATGQDSPQSQLYSDMWARIQNLPRHDHAPLLDLVTYLPEDILTKVDRASMAVSLEVRAPLLDHRVVELALRLPLSLKYRGRKTKWLLRRLLYKRVPRALVDRPKKGFGVPLADWFRGPLREQMESYSTGTDLEQLGVDPKLLRATWAAFKANRNQRVDYLWQMFILVAWARAFKTTPRVG